MEDVRGSDRALRSQRHVRSRVSRDERRHLHDDLRQDALPRFSARVQVAASLHRSWAEDGRPRAAQHDVLQRVDAGRLDDYIGFDWYRYSLINRYESWEYRDGQVPFHVEKEAVPPHHTVSYGEKPIWTTCDCNPEIIRLGRFGQWDKNTFVHHSYEAVRNALLKL